MSVCVQVLNFRRYSRCPVPFFFLRWCSCLAVMTTSTRNAAAAIRRLTIEYKQLTTDPNTLFPAVGPISEDNYLEWEALLPGPDDTPFEGGVFSARLSFRMYITITHKSTYIPLRAADHAIRSAYFPPKWCVCVHNPKLFSFSPYTSTVYPDGLVCISILHAAGDDPNSTLGRSVTYFVSTQCMSRPQNAGRLCNPLKKSCSPC